MDIGRVTIIPGKLGNRLSVRPSLFSVELLEFESNPVQHPQVLLSLSGAINCFVAPLTPATTVGNATLFLIGTQGGEEKDLSFDVSRIYAGAFPVVSRLGMPDVGDHHPVQLVHGAPLQVSIGPAYCWILSPDHQSLNDILVHGFKEGDVGVVLTRLNLGQVMEAKLVTFIGSIPVPCLEQADYILGRMLPPVSTIGVITLGGRPLQVLGKRGISINWYLQVAGQDMEQQAVVSRALYIGLTPHGIDATSGDSDVAQEKLQYTVRADILGAISVLGSAHGIKYGARFTHLAGSSISSANLKKGILRCTADTVHHRWSVAGKVPLHNLEGTVFILKGLIFLGDTICIHLVLPA